MVSALHVSSASLCTIWVGNWASAHSFCFARSHYILSEIGNKLCSGESMEQMQCYLEIRKGAKQGCLGSPRGSSPFKWELTLGDLPAPGDLLTTCYSLLQQSRTEPATSQKNLRIPQSHGTRVKSETFSPRSLHPRHWFFLLFAHPINSRHFHLQWYSEWLSTGFWWLD